MIIFDPLKFTEQSTKGYGVLCLPAQHRTPKFSAILFGSWRAASLDGWLDLPVKAAVWKDSCDLWVLPVVEHLGGENWGLVNEDAERDIPDLWDGLGQTDDGGHIALRHGETAD